MMEAECEESRGHCQQVVLTLAESEFPARADWLSERESYCKNCESNQYRVGRVNEGQHTLTKHAGLRDRRPRAFFCRRPSS